MTPISIIGLIGILLVLRALYDVFQKKHTILRNFPLIGHFRYLLESIGPELRQYIITSPTEEKPFNRNERRWIYASSKRANDKFGFGSDSEMELVENYIIVKPAAFPYRTHKESSDPLDYKAPCAKIMGAHRDRKKKFRPSSVVNISGMSFGALSGAAVTALNHGARMVDCLHTTGEGGISKYHKQGGDLVWNIGSGYFGCRTLEGDFSLSEFKDKVDQNQVKAIEVKLSQGAKPGLGGILPGAKVTAEIAETRGVHQGQDCASPRYHKTFSNVDEMLDFVELLASESGLPVGIKSAVGQLSFWEELATLMAKEDRGVDFITVDGGEGGTGAAPLVFTDHVAYPFKMAMSKVYSIFAKHGLHEKIVFIGSGKLGLPESALFAFALGCDMVNVGREALLSIGCIQSMQCHTNRCPTGVATQDWWLSRGLDPQSKSIRVANYIATLRKELIHVSWACGIPHPAFLRPEHIEVIDGQLRGKTVQDLFHYEKEWGTPSASDLQGLETHLNQT